MSGPTATTTVVMTRNRCADLRRTLSRHWGPVIVVDNGSADDTAAMVRVEFPDVRLVRLGHNAGAPARNVGVELARTPLVAFADDDSWWDPGALSRAEDCFRDSPRLGLLAARIEVGAEGGLDPVSEAMAAGPLGRDPELPGPHVLGFLGCGAVVRRAAFRAVGGFDDLIGFGGEEEVVALALADAGWGLAYVDDVVARHFPSGTRGTDEERQARLQRNHLLSGVMRRRWGVVVRRFAGALSSPAGRRGAVRAATRLAPALRRRCPVGPDVEADCALLERGIS